MHTTATALSDVVAGRVVGPGHRHWDTARQAFNLSVDQRPRAVVYPVDAQDAIAVVDYARARGLRIAPQATTGSATWLPSSAGPECTTTFGAKRVVKRASEWEIVTASRLPALTRSARL